jgi:hypothetical protein
MTEKKQWTSDEVMSIMEKAVAEMNGVSVESVERATSDNDYFTAIINGSLNLNELKTIARAIGDDSFLIDAEDYNQISLFFSPSEPKSDNYDDDYDPYREEREAMEREERRPKIELKHKDRFYDVWDEVVPGTEIHRSRTEECERLMEWIKEINRIPIYFLRMDDGIHCELSDIYNQKVHAVLREGKAVGGDGRIYTLENPDNLFPIGSDICVRATCEETGRSDAYGLSFFV